MTHFLILPCMTFSIQANYVPDLFVRAEFTSKGLAEAANYFVQLGETRSYKKLSELASNEYCAWPLSLLQDHSFSKSTRVCWMCRILYEPKKQSPLNSPDLPVTMPRMPLDRWPIFPLARSGDSFFVLSEAGIVMNRSESCACLFAVLQDGGKVSNATCAGARQSTFAQRLHTATRIQELESDQME